MKRNRTVNLLLARCSQVAAGDRIMAVATVPHADFETARLVALAYRHRVFGSVAEECAMVVFAVPPAIFTALRKRQDGLILNAVPGR